jgi:hypothetical protein
MKRLKDKLDDILIELTLDQALTKATGMNAEERKKFRDKVDKLRADIEKETDTVKKDALKKQFVSLLKKGK